MESELEAKIRKQLSEAKNKELSGHDIFGPPPELPARPLAARNIELRGNIDMALPQPRNIHTSVKVSNVSDNEIMHYECLLTPLCCEISLPSVTFLSDSWNQLTTIICCNSNQT